MKEMTLEKAVKQEKASPGKKKKLRKKRLICQQLQARKIPRQLMKRMLLWKKRMPVTRMARNKQQPRELG